MEAYDADELVSYRSLSNLAILAMLIGLLSPLALVVPLFIVIPLAGAAVALLAYSNIRAHAESLSGLTLAKIALFLSVFCLVAAPVKSLVRTQLYQRQADQAARQWLNTLAEGDLSEALGQLTPSAIGGLTKPDITPGNPASQPSVQDVVEALGKNQFVENIRAQAQDGPLELKVLSLNVDNNRSQPAVVIEYETNNQGDSSSVIVHCLRMGSPTSGSIWKIEAWTSATEPVHQH